MSYFQIQFRPCLERPVGSHILRQIWLMVCDFNVNNDWTNPIHCLSGERLVDLDHGAWFKWLIIHISYLSWPTTYSPCPSTFNCCRMSPESDSWSWVRRRHAWPCRPWPTARVLYALWLWYFDEGEFRVNMVKSGRPAWTFQLVPPPDQWLFVLENVVQWPGGNNTDRI